MCYREGFNRKYNNAKRPSKTDSAPVRGDGYEPGSSKFRLRANAETSHSVRYDMVVVVASIVGGEKFSHGMVRSRKPPPLVPLTITKEQLADILIKILSGPTFKNLVSQMNLQPTDKIDKQNP